MASKRNVRRKTCGKKRRYATEEQARSAALGVRRRDNAAGVNARTAIVAYRCPLCRNYHVGHLQKRRLGQ